MLLDVDYFVTFENFLYTNRIDVFIAEFLLAELIWFCFLEVNLSFMYQIILKCCL